MKRDAVMTCLLLANVCLLVYVTMLVWQRPSLYDIDARIEYWHNYYHDFAQGRVARANGSGETRLPVVVESAVVDFVEAPSRDERVNAPATGASNDERSNEDAAGLPVDEN